MSKAVIIEEMEIGTDTGPNGEAYTMFKVEANGEKTWIIEIEYRGVVTRTRFNNFRQMMNFWDKSLEIASSYKF